MEGEDDDIDLEELDENERAEFNVRISFCLEYFKLGNDFCFLLMLIFRFLKNF